MGGRELARLCRLLPGRLALDLAQELPVPRLASLGARLASVSHTGPAPGSPGHTQALARRAASVQWRAERRDSFVVLNGPSPSSHPIVHAWLVAVAPRRMFGTGIVVVPLPVIVINLAFRGSDQRYLHELLLLRTDVSSSEVRPPLHSEVGPELG
ncbi:hypothetical protein EMIHUDRAFT_239043 [Emiliania huxleyi CCMP1516]|uniref:Uncharacterized protein n=2 Tax=Emiliania huxleyi TaxID=2903 RepID=A0A0D3JJX3_EMIH1|nr:hypothetical protein EMIHUDRAFT_239043 [Emiliania huxleyi CCMP1516]EOD23808.1 hypothetical protein EMIHUDRAFT_239043 [Emiliania huxleyi CCMP1516]|eukprot:XP_005776237.1 hypothetical protein EMIHUDRAFT_239043 [Emiliania huxleyi CCMP1516]